MVLLSKVYYLQSLLRKLKMNCPECGNASSWKAGIQRGRQRFKCKQCCYHYTQSKKRGYSTEVKEKAVSLYLEGLGVRAIGRILGVSNVAVLNWIRQAAEALPEPKNPAKVDILELDEVWHFVKKRAENYGCGLLLTVTKNESLTSNSAVVVFKP